MDYVMSIIKFIFLSGFLLLTTQLFWLIFFLDLDITFNYSQPKVHHFSMLFAFILMEFQCALFFEG